MKRSIDHLTLKEVEEAKSYGLSSSAYDELREKFEMRLRDKLRDLVKKEVYASAEKELRVKLRVEVEEEIREQVKKKFENEERAKLEAKIRSEADSQVPDPKDLSAYREFTRDVELDCLAQAHAASDMADTQELGWNSSRRWKGALSWLLFLSQPAAWIASYRFTESWGVVSAVATAWLTMAIVWAVVASNKHKEMAREVGNLRKTSSDYWKLAETAKKVRIVDLPTGDTRAELRAMLSNLAREKQTQDDRFHPSAKTVTKARVAVKEELVEEMDPERLFEPAEESEVERRVG